MFHIYPQVMYPMCFQHSSITPHNMYLYLLQVLYSQCCQHNQFYPESTLYACVYSYLCLSSIYLLAVLSYTRFNQCGDEKYEFITAGRG